MKKKYQKPTSTVFECVSEYIIAVSSDFGGSINPMPWGDSSDAGGTINPMPWGDNKQRGNDSYWDDTF